MPVGARELTSAVLRGGFGGRVRNGGVADAGVAPTARGGGRWRGGRGGTSPLGAPTHNRQAEVDVYIHSFTARVRRPSC